VAALNLAIAHNGVILQAQKDVEAAAGESIQLKAILFPHVTHDASYSIRQDQLIEANQERELPSLEIPLPGGGMEKIGGGTFPKVNNQQWYADVEIVQSVYEGGRMASALRSSRLVRVEAALDFGTTVADTLLSVCAAYDDVIRTAKQVEVRDAAVTFLNQYLADTKAKFDAGAVPEFDYIRQQVELANAVAQQTQAVGDHRVAKQTFVELLGCNLPTTVGDDLPLDLTTPLEARPYRDDLSASLVAALHHRTELASLEAQEGLGDEAIVVAKAGLKPSVQIFAGYSVTSVLQTRTASEQLHGGLLGAQLSWPLFDGFLTKGKIDQAVALRGKTAEALAETTRVVELQVRTAWSDLRTARSVLEAQGQNVKKAERALELAKERYDAGSAPQIDVLSAQTALTDARGSYVDALRNYSVARTKLLRATGEDLQVVH
jgi:outer membrane protein TolC